MGGGSYSNVNYFAAASARAKSNTPDFAYTKQMHNTDPDQRKAHETLDPKNMKIRESRDSIEHPDSTAVAVFFDVTGSMGSNPQTIQKELCQLLGLVMRKGALTNPQILTGAYGDVHSDCVPLQVGQFESDNRIDEQLRLIYLEGNGGGNNGESCGLALYVLARKTSIDCWEKRGHKGYAFIVGDEQPHDPVRHKEIKQVMGDDIEGTLSIKQLVKEIEEKYNLYFLYVDTSAGREQGTLAVWRKMIGERAVTIKDSKEVSGFIAGIISVNEGATDVDGFIVDLQAAGANAQIAASVRTSLANAAGNATSAVAVATVTGGLEEIDAPSGNERL